jgi:hypothetical protein
MSYGSNADMQAFWVSHGRSAPAGADLDALRAIASVFVDGLGWRMAASGVPVSRFPGAPTSATQEDQWPRTGAKDIYGNSLADDAVPGAVERATYEAAWYEANNAGALNEAIRSDERIVREKFGSIEFQYADPTGGPGMAPTTPIIPAILTFLAPVLTGGTNPYGITGVVA